MFLFCIEPLVKVLETTFYLALQPKPEARPSVVEGIHLEVIQKLLRDLAHLAEEQINDTSGFVSQIIADL